jgi:hypothetical protein
MEVMLVSSFNLDAAVDAESNRTQEKQKNIADARNSAEAEATKILTLQFQSELDDALDRPFQNALQLLVLPITQISVLSMVACFQYLNTNFYLRRTTVLDSFYWEINYLSNTINCSPDSLKSRLLIEMGKLKSQLKEGS